MKRLNKKGFTLVELLAVIVVLAIIMIIAIPNVLNAMTTAKEKSFVIEARKILNKAQEQYNTEELTGTHTDTDGCYALDKLGLGATPGYTGSVKVTTSGAQIWLSDGTYIVSGATNDTLDDSGVVTQSKNAASTSCGA